MFENEGGFFVGGVGGPRTPEGGLTGKGGVVRVGMGWERCELCGWGWGGSGGRETRRD